jgi:hypothetical protein
MTWMFRSMIVDVELVRLFLAEPSRIVFRFAADGR